MSYLSTLKVCAGAASAKASRAAGRAVKYRVMVSKVYRNLSAASPGPASMSAPNENVLFVPNRNVLLTGTGWGGERTRSSHHDPAGPRPAGGIEESTEEADHAKPGGAGTRRQR